MFFAIQTRRNRCPYISCQIYVDIITRSNTGGKIGKLVERNFKRVVNVGEIDEVAKVATVFCSSVTLDIMVLSDYVPMVSPVKSLGVSV